jgi:flagellar protein FliO/FliZ
MKARFLTVVVSILFLPTLVLAAKGTEPSTAMGVVHSLLALGLVVALIFALAWFARRVTNVPGAASGTLRLLGGLSVGARERVVLIEIGGQQLLLGVAPGRVQTLHVLDQPVASSPHAAATSQESFAQRLAAMIRQGRPS